MGQSQSLATEIEIEASPDTVRSVFMDFPRWNQWCSWTVEPLDTLKESYYLKQDDTIKVDMKGMVFRPSVVENTPTTFAWVGNLYGLLVGKHEFHFSPSTKNPNGTLMIQSEEFKGVLAFLFGPGWSFRQNTIDGWNAFFTDLKKESERVSTSS